MKRNVKKRKTRHQRKTLKRFQAASQHWHRCGLLLQTVVCLSVSLSVTTVSPANANTAEPIVTPFGMWTRVSQKGTVC